MTTAWRATARHTTPPSMEVTDQDIIDFAFDAGEAVSSVVARIRNIDTATEVGPMSNGASAGSGMLRSVALAGNVATVRVTEFVRGTTYEMSVEFSRSDGQKWARLHVAECIA